MRIIVYFFCFFISFQAFSAPPSWVYRGDKRPPGIIFQEGFLPYGENNNLMGHLTGMTSSGAVAKGKKPTSNFVSTTSSMDIALEFALGSIQPSETRWVYTINARENFYPAMESARHIASVHNRDISPELSAILEREYEYSALGGVSTWAIQQAQEYTADIYGYVSAGRLITNPNFHEIVGSHANDSPYRGSDRDNFFDFPVRRVVGTNHTAGFALSEEDAQRTWIAGAINITPGGVSHSHKEL